VKVVVLCDDANGPVVRHRFRTAEPALRAIDLDDIRYVEIPKRLIARLALFRTLRDADVVVLVRKIFTWAELKALRAAAKSLVYDFDDAVMFRDPFRGEPVSHVRRRRFRHTVRSADAVTAGNDYLAELAKADAPDAFCRVVPTPVDTDRYVPAHVRHLGFRVGWIGSRATRGYLSLVAEPLRRVIAQRPDTVVAVMADAPPSQLAGVPFEFTPWSEEGEVPFLQSLDAGLMPLSDDPFSRGKCGFKLLQYLACGVPAVASPVGVNVDMCAEGEGRLASSADDWTSALLAIASDPDGARAAATRARDRVAERWSVLAVQPKLAVVLGAMAYA
jgi:glycosyltransferase involved in cell wall biosynthesis